MTRRKNSLDLLRILACIAVVFIHTNFHFFQEIYHTPSMRMEYVIENAINILTRFSVPCFIMLSGGFNLNRTTNQNFKDFYKKTSWRIGVPAFIASIVFLFVEILNAFINHSELINALIGYLTGFYALWYLLVLAGLYILTPFIVNMKTALTEHQYSCLAILMIVWGCISQAVSNYKLPYTIGTVGAFLGYYIIGDVIINHIKKHVRPMLCFLCSALLFFITWIIRYVGIDYYTYVTYRNFFSPTIIVASMLILLGFKELEIEMDLSYASRLTFHVYLIHTLVLNSIFYILSEISTKTNEILIIFIVAFITIVLSFIIAIVLDKFWSNRENWRMKWYAIPIWK